MKQLLSLLQSLFAVCLFAAGTVTAQADDNTTFSFSENFNNASFKTLPDDGWTYEEIEINTWQGVGGTKCIKLAISDKDGSLTTPALTNMPNASILTFSAKKLSNNANLSLLGANCTFFVDGIEKFTTSFSLTTTEYQNFTVVIHKLADNPTITFSATKGKSVYLDDVSIIGYVPVTITTAKYATFCNEMATDFSGTGITVYKVKVEGNVAKMTAVSDGIVPAGAGVVLYKDVTVSETINVPMTTTSAALEDNEMVGVTTRTEVTRNGEGGKYNYILQVEGDGIAFNMATDGGAYMPAGRAYLSTTHNAAASRLSVLFVNETIIKDVRANTGVAYWNGVYDLQGRRMSDRKSLARGLYIVGGRVTMVK